MANTTYLKRKHVSKFLRSSRDLGKRGVLLNDYDEPTYIGFWVEFDFVTPSLTNSDFIDYNRMPNGLLGDVRGLYSAERYLKSINEERKAQSINAFRKLLHDVSKETPDAIKSISGIDTLYRLDPQKSWRASESIITLNFDESIDNRITAMFDLYRRGSFDETFMRWCLPDIHRYFKMNVYLTEFRAFHTPRNAESSTTEDTSITRNVYGGNGRRNGQSFLNQKVSDYQDQYDNIEDSINRAQTAATTPFDPGGFVNDPLETPQGDYFLKALDKKLSIIKFELSDCEIILPELMPSWTEEISNSEAGEMASASMQIKVGRVCEVNEYSALGASLFLGLSEFSEYVVSCKFKNQSVSLDKYYETLGDGSYNSVDGVYSNSNYPYANGHLQRSDNEIFQSIGERLLENTTDFVEGQITEAVTEEINRPFLGNVYDGSASTAIRSLAADPRALGQSFSQLINNTNGENASDILSNIDLEIQNNPNLIKNNPNINLNYSDPKPSETENIDLNQVDVDQDISENVGLNQVELNDPSLGNVDLDQVELNESSQESIELRTPEINQGSQEKIELRGPEINQGSQENVNLNYSENDSSVDNNIELQDVPETSNDVQDIQITEPSVNRDTELGSEDLEFTEPQSQDTQNLNLEEPNVNQSSPGNQGLEFSENISTDTSDVNLDYPSKQEAGKDQNVNLLEPEKPNERNENVGIEYSAKSDNDLEKTKLDYPNISPSKDENVNLRSPESGDNNISDPKLNYPDSSLNDQLDSNINLDYENINNDVPENANIEHPEIKRNRPQSVDLKVESKKKPEIENADLEFPNTENKIPENIRLKHKDVEKRNALNNIDLDYEKNLKKEKPKSIDLNTPIKDKAKESSINLKAPEDKKNINLKANIKSPENKESNDRKVDINFKDRKTHIKDKNIYNTGDNSDKGNDSSKKNVGIDYKKDHETFPKEGTKIQSTKPIKKPKRKNE